MLINYTDFSHGNLLFLTKGPYTLTENSAHRLDRSTEYYSKFSRELTFSLLNATSNIQASSGTPVFLYSENFFNDFYKGDVND